MGWQWHQLDNRQIIFTSLETDNDASTSPLSFYRPDVLPDAQPTASQYWRHKKLINITTEKLNLTHKQLLGLFICVWKYEYFMLLITAELMLMSYLRNPSKHTSPFLVNTRLHRSSSSALHQDFVTFYNTTTKTISTILRPLHRTTCVSQHLQVRTGGFY